MLPTDPDDPSKVKPLTEPPTPEEVAKSLREKDKVEEDVGKAMLSSELEKIQ